MTDKPTCKTPGCNNDAALKEYRPDGTPKYRTVCNTCRNAQKKQKQSLKPKARARKQTHRAFQSEPEPIPEEITERPKLDVDSGFIDARYEELRDRLLDLSRRNPLINFKHSKSGTRYIRVIDESPDSLFKFLLEGEMKFAALPDVDEEPADEATEAFQQTLESWKAQGLDENYTQALENEALQREDGVHYQQALTEAERQMRDSIRVLLNLPPLQSRTRLDIEAHAKIHGFDPSFDLGVLRHSEHHDDKLIQCLLTPEQLDRRLRSVYAHTQEFQRDTGINVLTTIFGFLEWIESSNSEEKNLSPLILLPSTITRERSANAYQYSLSSDGDLPCINKSLEEKLALEFGVELPQFDPEEPLEVFFEQIEELAANHHGWALRKFVTVGVCPFSTISILQDLVPSAWDEDEIYQHQTIADLFAAREKEVSGEINEIDDIDQLTISGDAPPLVLDADSSQHTAIRKVLEGHSIVIEGPPGTGKSQTIANIIAAAVAEGKRVLFVAEKQPALDVVSNRLRDVGLEALMLEPQRKGPKEAFIESLRIRLHEFSPFSINEYDDKKEKLVESICSLNKAKDLMAKPSPYMGLTVFELIWRYIRVANEFDGEAPATAGVSLDFASFTEAQFAGLNDLVARHFEFVHQRSGEVNCIENFNNLSPNRIAAAEFQGEVRALLASLQEAATLADALPEEATSSQETLHSFANAMLASEIEWRSLQEIDASIESDLASRTRLEQASVILSEHSTLNQLTRENADSISKLLKQLSRDEAEADQLGGEISELRADIDEVDFVLTLAARFGLNPNIPAASTNHCISLLFMIRGSYQECAWVFDSKLQLDQLSHSLDALKSLKWEICSACSNILTGDPVEFFGEYTATEIDFVIDAYSNKGFFSFLSSRYRTAKKIIEQLGIEARNPVHLLEQLKELQNGFCRIKDLEDRTALSQDLGKRYAGLATDIDAMEQACAVAAQILSGCNTLNEHGCTLSALEIYELSISNEALSATHALMAKDRALNEQSLLDWIQPSRERAQLLDSLAQVVASAGFCGGRSINLAAISQIECNAFRASRSQDRAEILGEFLDIAQEARELVDQSEQSIEDYSRAIDQAKEARDTQCLYAGHLNLGSDSLLQFNSRPRAEQVSLLSGAANCLHAIEHFARKYGLSSDTSNSRWITEWQETLNQIAERDLSYLIQDIERLHVCRDIDHSAYRDFFKSARFKAFNDAKSVIDYAEFAISSFILKELAQSCGLDREEFTGYANGIKRSEFRELDSNLRQLDAQLALSVGLDKSIPSGTGRGPKRDWTNLALIENECSKQRRYLPVRELVRRAKDALLEMKPIWLMQPLTVSQMLPKTTELFDLVLIDEASQMLPEMAAASILRGKQTVVVGDDKQMPPSSFFKFSIDEEDEESEIEGESILDLATGRFREVISLRWHYRSQHESLIQFSNAQFYKDMLEVIPSAHHRCGDLGVERIKVNGAYKGGLNIDEALAMIHAVREFIIKYPNRSIGLVTMNTKQRDFIEEEFLRLADKDPAVREYVDRWSNEELDYPMIRSLERVQGDERDAIFISTVYGPDNDGKMYQRFPLINTDHGHRRLNVLFTRARRKVVLVTSMDPSHIKLDENSKHGKRALRDYIEYAATGRLETGKVTGESADSDFEISVSEVLETAGFKVTPQVGVRGFKIDLGIEHPDYPNGFLAGIECDGATYHSSRFARDRDAIRQDILESLGWKIYRIWSTDWFKDSKRETEKMLQWLSETKDSSLQRDGRGY
jgi:very-short-patch-repair endonuclease